MIHRRVGVRATDFQVAEEWVRERLELGVSIDLVAHELLDLGVSPVDSARALSATTGMNTAHAAVVDYRARQHRKEWAAGLRVYADKSFERCDGTERAWWFGVAIWARLASGVPISDTVKSRLLGPALDGFKAAASAAVLCASGDTTYGGLIPPPVQIEAWERWHLRSMRTSLAEAISRLLKTRVKEGCEAIE